MALLTQSYASGISSVPLIGDTIGVHFDKAASRWAIVTRLSCASKMCAGPTRS